MFKKTLLALAALSFSALAYSANTTSTSTPPQAQIQVQAQTQVPAMSAAQQKQIEDVVHNYLVKNPEVIVEAVQVLQQKQMQQAEKNIQKTQQVASKFADMLIRQAGDPVVGNVNGKITLVEFFDYQCPHCVEMTPIIEGLIKSNPELRIVFKEFPIRGPMSETASRAALAARIQGKYYEFHSALMRNIMEQRKPLTEEVIYKIAQSVPGLNVDKLKTDMKSETVNQQIKTTYKLAQDLQLIGTPAFFIAKTDANQNTVFGFVPGRAELGQLQDAIKKAGQ